MNDRTHAAIISYRAEDPQAAAGGYQAGAYHVELAHDWSGSRDVILRYGRQVLAVADVAAQRSAGDSHQVQVAFVRDHHQVWIADEKVIDYWEIEGGRTGPGHIGFGGYYSAGTFDDFRVAEARSDALGPTFDTTNGRIAPLVFQGRPFFALGTFDRPVDDVAEWLEAGGNAAIVGVMGQNQSAESRQAGLQEVAGWAGDHDVALSYYPLIDFYSKEGDKTIPTRPEEIAAKEKLLDEMLTFTADHRQTLGYWTFDEIENHLYKAYEDWEDGKDTGLAEWIGQTMRWTYDTIKTRDPDSYVMPTIAWWSTYEGLAALYDVNVPNEYPTREEFEPLEAPLYNIAYDSVRAADAVRATGRTSFVYMPGIFDAMAGWRAPTRGEMRYCWFAPLTQGATGILAWRLGRCSPDYRRGVVYPVMREVKALVPWLLGEWHDEKVTSNRDTATAKYLKEFPQRIQTVREEGQAEMIEIDAVPDCSHMLRRRPDNTYLLLAVNNTRKALPVSFTLQDIAGLPEHALERIDYRPVPIDQNRISDTIEPFGVRAYVIAPG